ncbi:MAG: glycosyltransferase [Anaerolineaceae bacterium]|nr:glycosyltransferase [Anaerolineaceae bacterium]
MSNIPKKPHILFLFSDTGGGHRAAATAIQEALTVEFPGQVDWEMVDFFKDYAPPPLNKAGPDYSNMAQLPDVWEMFFEASNTRTTAKLAQYLAWPLVKSGVDRLIEEHPCDLIISVHPIINPPILRAFGENRPPYLTVVTDLITTHQYWYNRGSDIIIVPTEEAFERGIKLGVDADKMHIVGLPIKEGYRNPIQKQEARKKLELPTDLPLVLMVSGGDGMGPLEETVAAINDAKVPTGLVIIAGRNQALKQRLESLEYPHPAFIKGFTTDMPTYMQACDIIITKAGPGTISEACIAGLPIILYSKIPGQENGNVDYVLNHKAGVWENDPKKVAGILKDWIENPGQMKAFAEASRSLGRPDASHLIAQTAMALLGLYDMNKICYYDKRNPNGSMG